MTVHTFLAKIANSFSAKPDEKKHYVSTIIDDQLRMYPKLTDEEFLENMPTISILIKWLAAHNAIFLKPKNPGLFKRISGQYVKGCADPERLTLMIDIHAPNINENEFLRSICNEVIHLTGISLKRFSHSPINLDDDSFLIEEMITSIGGGVLYAKISGKTTPPVDLSKLVGIILLNHPNSQLTIDDAKKAQEKAIIAVNLVCPESIPVPTATRVRRTHIIGFAKN